jgi:HSP20 family protein
MARCPARERGGATKRSSKMKLDLSKWNPFKFSRHHSNEQRTSASPGRQMQQQQQGQAAAASTQMGGGGLPQAWLDPNGLPEPMRMMTDMLRDPFGGFALMDRWFGDFSPAAFQPRIDVVDDRDALRIVAELPGMDREDVEVTVEDDFIVLRGEKKLEQKAEEEGCYRVERAFGTFQRVIPLPDGVDAARAEAKFENGTLTIRLPKIAGAKSTGRKLDIGKSSSSPAGTASSGTGRTASASTSQQG